MTPRTDWSETVDPGEAARFERYAEELRDLQRQRSKGPRVDRALHAKANAGLFAELTVLPDLPEHARTGLFAAPRTYRTYVRFSNGAGERSSDRRPDVRGLALKVVGVEGKKLIPGLEDAKTQDFLFIRTPATPFRTTDEFMTFVRVAKSPLRGLAAATLKLGPIRTLQIVRRVMGDFKEPVRSLAAAKYFTASSLQLGRHAVHCALKPTDTSGPERANTSREALTEELSARLRAGPVSYDFQLQFYVDAQRTPIEDTSVEWSETDSPFITVARLTIPSQDPSSPRGRRIAEYVETLSFDPWHAQTELRPLGNIMRARNQAYRLSTLERKAAQEPDGSESFDGP